MTMRLAAMLCILCGCNGVTVLRYQPSSTSIVTPGIDHPRSSLPRPARGEAIAANLADGFPVWVVHHADGTISVLSAVAPPRAKMSAYPGVSGQVERDLVSWDPVLRRFDANRIVFDERGHALGYAGSNRYAGSPGIEAMPVLVRDLDTFAVSSQGSTIEVGPLVTGDSRRAAASWLPWPHHAAGAPALARRSLTDALALADGQYAIVDGDSVRSTDAEPVICKAATSGCGTCGSERLPLAGIAASDAAHIYTYHWWYDPLEYLRSRHAVYIGSEAGTFLVQRHGSTFQIVASTFRGTCGGSW